ncbi:LD-carboxypeptidase [Alkaliphilus sp. MSJ-5]|uniref:LD-carboxypeptidase n=1 Tax=Alkaliphilus flagellatus TaxID=2841507 RepID=A0ABS6G229_9FIRM|nr:LD-carboxypeptidase [Alkaliphilus flagellatus]MBU5676226.1 LD-carboxypeptidase [Alkaliphilus flagellatus]
MLKPKALKLGDMIGVIAPSSPTTEANVKLAKEQLEGLGFNVKLAPSCYATHGYLAGTDQLRADDLNNMFSNKEIKGIVCLRGGYGAPRILNKIDFELIKANPKVFVGYSDITALHMAINQISNLVTFHGPMASSDIAEGLDDFSKKEFLRAIMEPQPMGNILNPKDKNMQCLVGGKARGVIIGGNLSLVTATIGTTYEIDTKGKILFLEEIGEEPYKVDRMLTQLALAGKLKDAAGIILGDWNDCESTKHYESLSLMEVFQEIIVPYGRPTIFDLKAGHCTPKVTLPFGVNACLDAYECKLTIEESGLI